MSHNLNYRLSKELSKEAYQSISDLGPHSLFSNRTPKSKCLNDVPVKEKRLSDSFYSNPGAIFDVTSQCRIHGGENAKGCYYGDPMEVCCSNFIQ